MSKVIVLASGGLDSTLCIAKLLKEGHSVVPFFTNYSQYSYQGEVHSVRRLVRWFKDHPPQISHWLGKGLPSDRNHVHDMVEARIDVGQPVAAAPGRMLAFVGAATIWAYTNGWDEGRIAIGIHKGDRDEDSCRVGYEDVLNTTLGILTQDCMEIVTPLMGMSREDIARELESFKIPWDLMYNCYWYPACGWQSKNVTYLCPGCRRKLLAMETVGHKFPGAPNTGGVLESSVTRRDWTKWD